MKRTLSFFIFLFIFSITSASYSQTCLTITVYYPGCSTLVGQNIEVRFTRFDPSYSSFSLYTDANSQIYYCYDPDDVNYFIDFPMLDCDYGCEVYFVPKHIGSFKLVYACYPNCNCDEDHPKGENGNLNILPEQYALHQNYPNPFNPTTKISFDLPKEDNINLSVFDLSGKLVKTIVNGSIAPGSYQFDFDASEQPSGIYIYKLTTSNYEQSRKMVLIK